MKKIIAIALASMMLLGLLAGCGASNNGGSENASSGEFTTVTPGKLTVATSPDFAPMEFVDATKEGQDKYVGFDMTMAHYFAEQLGLELVISPMSFDACMTAVQMGTVDMALSGFSWKEDRAANFNLSNGYYTDNEDEQTLITLKENENMFPTMESLSGMKVGAQTASLQETLCKEQLPHNELIVVSDLTTALMQLRNGDFDVLAVAKGNADAIIANNPDIAKAGFYFVVDEKYTGNVVMLQKGNDALTEKVNELLEQSKDLWETWYDDAKALAGISGVNVTYDDEGNEITEPAE